MFSYFSLKIGTGVLVQGEVLGVRIMSIDVKEQLIQKFLSDKSNKELYQQYLKDPTKEVRELLDWRFKKFYFRIRTLSYFSKMLHFESKNFDKKERSYQVRFPLILDDSINDEGNVKVADLIQDTNYKEMINGDKLEDYIEDSSVYRSVQNLTDKQKEILYLVYVKNMQDTEVARLLGVSQQSVTKTKNKAIQKVRRDLNA
jgi:RNA polymerase sigma factor (sigma-70 family)